MAESGHKNLIFISNSSVVVIAVNAAAATATAFLVFWFTRRSI